jgi:hypothetical protein
MSFLRRRKSKVKTIRSESDLDFQKGLDASREGKVPEVEPRPPVGDRPRITLEEHITRLEEKLNTPETRSSPPNHINIIRNLAKAYIRMGAKGNIEFYPRAENLFKQFSVLYPLHMEKIDWISWIEASAKSKLIREARNLLAEARLLFPGDEALDEVETEVLHIDHAKAGEGS